MERLIDTGSVKRPGVPADNRSWVSDATLPIYSQRRRRQSPSKEDTEAPALANMGSWRGACVRVTPSSARAIRSHTVELSDHAKVGTGSPTTTSPRLLVPRRGVAPPDCRARRRPPPQQDVVTAGGVRLHLRRFPTRCRCCRLHVVTGVHDLGVNSGKPIAPMDMNAVENQEDEESDGRRRRQARCDGA